jgi:hypothetical protein
MLQHIIVFWIGENLTHEQMLNGNEMQEYTNIGAVTNDFVLNLLPTFHTPFNEHLRGKREAARRKITKFVWIVSKT